MTEAYSKTKLDNGLRVLSENIPHLRSIAIGVWITLGSRDETAEINGMAHLIEHMVFKGTQKRSAADIALSLEAVGGSLDAFTSKEVTCFSAHVLDEHLELAVDVLSDLVLNPTFPEAEYEKEKQVIIREIHHTLETPDDLIFEYFFQNIYPDHALGFPIAGTLESVNRIQRPEMLRFIEQYYTPDRMVIAAAGNVNHAELVELVQKYFRTDSRTSARHLEAPQWPASGRQNYFSTGSQAHICLGVPGYAFSDDKKYDLLLIGNYLGNGMSSRLFQVVREQHGLVYTIFSFPEFFLDSGLMGIYAATQTEHAEKVLELIHQEIEAIHTRPFDVHELDRLKAHVKGNLMLSLENTSSRMSRLANMEILLQDFISLDQVLASVEACTLRSIRDVARETLAPKQFVITVLAPDRNE